MKTNGIEHAEWLYEQLVPSYYVLENDLPVCPVTCIKLLSQTYKGTFFHDNHTTFDTVMHLGPENGIGVTLSANIDPETMICYANGPNNYFIVAFG